MNHLACTTPSALARRGLRRASLFLLAALMAAMSLQAQVAIKSNLLYDATTTPNLGVEIGIGGKSTLNLVYGLNPWRFNSESHGKRFARHWVLMPEYRWWPCTRMTGHFFGVHAMVGELNVSNVNLPLPGGFVSGINLREAAKDGRYQGPFAGVGVTYGYQWPLSRHWNLEAEIGAGYAHVWYDRYPCGECGMSMERGGANYLGVTKVGVSLMYVF